MHREIDHCRICGNTRLTEVLDLGLQALTGIFPKSRAEPVETGPLKLVKCTGRADACGLLQLGHSYDPNTLYGWNYGYRSGLNPSMVAHLQAIVCQAVSRAAPPDGAIVLDIGANDSTALQACPDRYRLIGVDPVGEHLRRFYPNHIELIPRLFSAADMREYTGGRAAHLILSFSMFYDLESPQSFMREIAQVLHQDGIWVCEQSYLPTMLRRTAYDTVCHEHLEYYTLRQLQWMARQTGLKIVDVELNDINGGSFLVTLARQGSHHPVSSNVARLLDAESAETLDALPTYRAFEGRVSRHQNALRQFLLDARRQGKSVSALGASTKGNVLLQYCGVSEREVDCVGEVNADKFGHVTPGSLLPIVPEAEVLDRKPDYLLVLPWHFRDFFVKSPRYTGQRLLFPLPELEVVQC